MARPDPNPRFFYFCVDPALYNSIHIITVTGACLIVKYWDLEKEKLYSNNNHNQVITYIKFL